MGQGETRKSRTDRNDPRHRLETLVQRSRAILFAEDFWRALLPVLTVAGIFIGLSWLGIWIDSPVWLRVIGLLGFAAAFLWSVRGFYSLRWPTRQQALARVEEASGTSHRPLTALTDDLANATDSPSTSALWKLHLKRMAKTVAGMRTGTPDPRAYRQDPYALRLVAALLVIVGFFATGPDRWSRLGAAFQVPADTAAIASRLDAWVTPPLYTNEPPIYLTGESAAFRDPGQPVTVPEGSVLVVRSQGNDGLSVAVSKSPEDAVETVAPENGNGAASGLPAEFRVTLEKPSVVLLKKGETAVAQFPFLVRPDNAPEIALTQDPEQLLSGALKFAYRMDDDYGVVAAEARIAPVLKGRGESGSPRPLVEAPQFPLSLPPRSGDLKTGETIRDLTSHPWAGSEVYLHLTARDEAGQEGYSPPHRFVLPQRLFRKPLARAVVEQRRDLALDANNQTRAITAIDALLVAPEVFEIDTRTYLGMRFAYKELVRANSDEELKALLPLLWDLALTIEDGDLSMAERALRDAQEALRQALENGASDEEIAELTQQLREALNDYMQALAEQMRNNPQAMQPFNPNQQMLNQQDLSDMLNRIEELARTGSRDAARELLAQMQQMLENLQAGRPQMMPGAMTNEMMQMLDELGRMIQQQQQLMDQTHQFNNQRQQQPGQQGQQGEGQQMTQKQLQQLLDQLQQGQGDLAQQLQQLMDQLGQNGMGQSEALGEAGESMGEAQQSLGQGRGQRALGQQGDALDALRRGAQGMAEQMMGQGEGPGLTTGRSPMDEDPLGRPRRSEGPDFGNRVQVPDEIDVQRARRILEELRRRFSDPNRPQIELDYLERLLNRN
ncbi:TIGR02302 family protein [Roseibium sp. RKSG952]|uniref:TIGR02302 family protein n=1 Tax=Roseibium sp. RKSG952 TaxID=2529384 RepID=UPI001AD94E1B|nr:TIGR02302 family protein [Roseibium sp. RKSG952]